MTWHLFPLPEGAGGGVAGLEDVTGTFPIVVESLGTDRNITLDREPPEEGVGEVPPGIFGSIGRHRFDLIVALDGTTDTDAVQAILNGPPDTIVSIDNTSFYTSAVRGRYRSPVGLNQQAPTVLQGTGIFRGVPAGTGGFLLEWMMGFHALNSDSKMLLGAAGTSFTGAQEPSTSALNCMFFGYDSGDTNMQFMHNDGTGTCTKIDLGADFPRPTVDRDVYYMVLRADPANSRVHYLVQRADDPDKIAFGTVGMNLQAGNLGLTMRWNVSTGPTTTTRVEWDFMRLQLYTEM